MKLFKIKLINFKNFNETHDFHFTKVNLIRGNNGCGKSTLIKDSILFALYGNSETSLDKLPTKGKNNCRVDLYIDNFIISREYPTKIKICEIGPKGKVDSSMVGLEFATNRVAQEWINNNYKIIDVFKKFRMIDLQQGINILEEGKVSLRKTLFSFNDSLFNKIRLNLQSKKREREIYNKDNLIEISKHYPSKKRLKQIEVGLVNITEQMYSLDRDIRVYEQDYYGLTSKRGQYDGSKSMYKSQKDKILQYSSCPTCKRRITKDTKMELLKDINSNITRLDSEISKIIEKISDQNDSLTSLKNIKNKLQSKKEKFNKLYSRLENRLSYKDYKWTNRDVTVMSQAIKELDGFSSYYITEWIKILEPIINDIINKAGFTIKFDLDEKGNIDIIFFKDGEQYGYKDLSSGQRLIVSIGFQLALLMERGESGLVIADEGFSSLDADNLKMVLDVFKNLPFQLLCVVHRLNDIPDNVNIINLGE